MEVNHRPVIDAAFALFLLIINCVAVTHCSSDYSYSSAVNETVKSNILVLSPYTFQSHSNFVRPVVKELASRGHTVTYWNGLKPAINDKSLKHNLRQLYSPVLGEFNSDHKVTFNDRGQQFSLLFTLYDRTVNICQMVYNDPIFHQLMTTDERFDLVIVEGFLNECVLPLVHKLEAPLVYISSLAPIPWILEAIGSPLAFDHFPLPTFSFTDRMDFLQRAVNAISGLFALYFRNLVLVPTVDRLASQMLTNVSLPSVRAIEQESLSLLITNIHSSMNYQLPMTPNIIEAGGLHCVPSKPLPKDLEEFVSGSGDEGFIIVSFGSILRGSNMSPEMRRSFISTFRRLKQRVIWKWEDETKMTFSADGDAADVLPANVKLVTWLPQQDLLGHPKARLFITHGGLCSKQEAVYHGVPLISMPVFADQFINAQKAHDDGYAIHFDWDKVAEEDALYDAIQQVLNNPSYTERVRHVSELMRDQKERPLDRAVYWIEYVIRHQGAPHLRSSSRYLNLFQRDLIDIALIIFSFFIAFVYVVLRTINSKRISSASIHYKRD